MRIDRLGWLILGFAVGLGGCVAGDDSVDVGTSAAAVEGGGYHHHHHGIDQQIRDLAHDNGMKGFPHLERNITPEEQVMVNKRAELGRFLFYDRALSGVEHTSCGTCHNGHFTYADGQLIARGIYCNLNEPAEDQTFCFDKPSPEDGDVVGHYRTAPLNNRNTPSAINAGLMPALMVNGRFHFQDPAFVNDHVTDVNQLDPSYGFDVRPPENTLFVRSLLSGQAFKPVAWKNEMAGDWPFLGQPFPPEAERDSAIDDGLAARISSYPEYRELFYDAYSTPIFPSDPVVNPGDDIPWVAIADAIAQFQEVDLEMTNAPWDHFLTGDDDAISAAAKRGAKVFFTTGKCSSCHSGDQFNDFKNWNMGVPAIGPGTYFSDDSDPAYLGLFTWDFGLEEITGNRADRFKFRTTALRGVTLTAPYMHDGAALTLRDAIKQHINPARFYRHYDFSKIQEINPEVASYGLKPMGPIFDAKNPVAVGPGTPFEMDLCDRDIDDLIEFLKTLTDPRMLHAGDLAPEHVPSGIPTDVPGPAFFPSYQ